MEIGPEPKADCQSVLPGHGLATSNSTSAVPVAEVAESQEVTVLA